MRTRLIIIVLTLVILPTAILSFMAARTVRSRELVLREQLRISAVDAVRSVITRMHTRLADDLRHVQTAMTETLGRSPRFMDMDAAGKRLQHASAIIDHVYIFFNPWGLIYPDDTTSAGSAGMTPGSATAALKHAPLIAALRRGVLNAGNTDTPLHVRLDNTYHIFTPILGRNDMYAGFSINLDAFKNQLTAATQLASLADYSLQTEWESEPTRDVTITDSLGTSTSTAASTLPLATGTLAPPFNQVRILAVASDPGWIERSARDQTRLYGWSIALLACGIVAGVWIVLRVTALELQHIRTRSDFLVGVSHDLRTPISSMKVLAESLHLGHVTSDTKRKQFLSSIVKECNRLSDMIERVLFFIREEHGRVHYARESIDPGDLVTSAVEAFRERIQDASAISLTTSDNLPQINANANAISKVLFNLLDNALKYSGPEAGGKRPGGRGQGEETRGKRSEARGQEEEGVRGDGIAVRVARVTEGREWVVISVTDHGVGIDKRERKRVFQKFYRASLEREGTTGGIGLGLALCQNIVKAHGGRIEVQSEPGKGSTFSVFLPTA